MFATSEDRYNVISLISAIEKHKDYEAVFSKESKFVRRVKILLALDSNLGKGHRQFAAEEYGIAKDYYNKVKDSFLQLARHMEMTIYALPPDGSSIEHEVLTPVTSDAKSFRNSLDPSRDPHYSGKLLFGKPVPWGTSTWMPWTDMAGGHHEGNWEQGLSKGWWDPVDVPNKKIPHDFPFSPTLIDRLKWRCDQRAGIIVNSLSNLEALENLNTATVRPPQDYSSYKDFLSSLEYNELTEQLYYVHDDLISLMPHVIFFIVPICLGDTALEMGDFPASANHYAQVSREQLLRGSINTPTPNFAFSSEPYGNMPWNWVTLPASVGVNGHDYPYTNKRCELPFLLLRLGKLYLNWADNLYRTDQEAEVYRARELYKAVLRQYGVDPLPKAGLTPLPLRIRPRHQDDKTVLSRIWRYLPKITIDTLNIAENKTSILEKQADNVQTHINRPNSDYVDIPVEARAAWAPVIDANVSPVELAQPHVDFASTFLAEVSLLPMFFPVINPAVLAQRQLALIGITKIDEGLNYYGYAHDIVPVLRYKPLASSAQHFTTLSRQAESDFISFKKYLEDEEVSLMRMRSAVAASAIRVEIESQRVIEAADYVQQAEIQVQQVKDAIAAKENEIEEHAGFCGQVKDFFSGIKDFFGSVPEKASDYIGSDFWAAFGFSKLTAGTTAGAGITGGIGLFAVATGFTLSAIADMANQRVSELEKLQTQQLPMALIVLDARRREYAIAQLQNAVSKLEALYAQEVLCYSLLRTMNVDMWANMASAMKVSLRRYLDLGAVTGWLAERALSYAQNRDIRLVRFNYFKPQRQGLLASETLQADLASLEREYIIGLQQTTPIKWTFSIARDFPLQFGQLIAKGSCTFMTSAAPFDLAYPGTYNHRIRSVEVAAIVPVTETPPKGILSNLGISRVQDSSLENSHTIVRPPNMLPLSEFSLKEDMAVYQIPGEMLMAFEGSGIETFWTLEFSAAANPKGLTHLADICITFYLDTQFSHTRKLELSKADPQPISRSVLFSAKHLFPHTLNAFLSGGDQAVLEFDITGSLLPKIEKERNITNIVVYLMGKNIPSKLNCELASNSHPNPVKFTVHEGLAYSYHVPQPSTMHPPHSDLNPIAVGKPQQKWKLTIPATGNPGFNRKVIEDIILGIEYTAEPAFGE